MKAFIIFLSIVATTCAAPGKIVAAGTLQTSNAYSDSPVTLDLGNVGVNFGGFHASAGLGGLLTGDASKGGLHAEAGTPFGQEAGAGLGGGVDANGKPQIKSYYYARPGSLPNIDDFVRNLGADVIVKNLG